MRQHQKLKPSKTILYLRENDSYVNIYKRKYIAIVVNMKWIFIEYIEYLIIFYQGKHKHRVVKRKESTISTIT